jgi:hypothetical protein
MILQLILLKNRIVKQGIFKSLNIDRQCGESFRSKKLENLKSNHGKSTIQEIVRLIFVNYSSKTCTC